MPTLAHAWWLTQLPPISISKATTVRPPLASPFRKKAVLKTPIAPRLTIRVGDLHHASVALFRESTTGEASAKRLTRV